MYYKGKTAPGYSNPGAVFQIPRNRSSLCVSAPAGGGAADAASGASAQIDLNTATAEQLDSLPGIGPVTASKILAWRTEHGRFSVVDELAEVPGIGPKTLAELRSHVRV